MVTTIQQSREMACLDIGTEDPALLDRVRSPYPCIK